MKCLAATLLMLCMSMATITRAQTGPWAKYDNKMKGEALVRDADGGYLESVKSIVAGGGDVNWQLQPTGLTPLMAAASGGKIEVVRYLLEQGADPTMTDANGRTALDRARMFGANDVVKLLTGYTQVQKPGTGKAVVPVKPVVKETKPVAPAPAGNKPKAGGSTNWPSFGSYKAGDKVMFWANGWKSGVVKEVGIATNKEKNAKPFEKKYLVAPDAYANWPDWMDWSVVVTAGREPFWTAWFTGEWMLGEVMAHTTRDEGSEVVHTYSYYSATEALKVNADGTYQWKPGGKDKEINGRWKPAPDGPGIVLLKGYRGLDWTVRNESSATELHVRGMEKIRLYPSAVVMSISGKRKAAPRKG